ncbi:hypothetical protein PC129_g3317 [Phytophthora cactorum]|uniref:Uncharacterized protein n=1 Tax=Phytophthora cactorum TaxID=29920 RepID=A0A329T104_9STRA|nr:hypothetical protein Pcac1_g23748 [Phytophthora cactorum]KAG2833166.1 hypothetical protein PC112_g6599 [Phytophthora cactorum]KAG2917656.1 hypothetical protein PC114_g7065 [Phytophthora cactorum]KAG2931837.1 hypothetical protein PC115_g5996 [Phytophthora cactorum]KAG2947282.1 hypothetical protein PC117_g6939 [Phytophthora cactorum]
MEVATWDRATVVAEERGETRKRTDNTVKGFSECSRGGVVHIGTSEAGGRRSTLEFAFQS